MYQHAISTLCSIPHDDVIAILRNGESRKIVLGRNNQQFDIPLQQFPSTAEGK
jgi:hypothetical protein